MFDFASATKVDFFDNQDCQAFTHVMDAVALVPFPLDLVQEIYDYYNPFYIFKPISRFLMEAKVGSKSHKLQFQNLVDDSYLGYCNSIFTKFMDETRDFDLVRPLWNTTIATSVSVISTTISSSKSISVHAEFQVILDNISQLHETVDRIKFLSVYRNLIELLCIFAFTFMNRGLGPVIFNILVVNLKKQFESHKFIRDLPISECLFQTPFLSQNQNQNQMNNLQQLQDSIQNLYHAWTKKLPPGFGGPIQHLAFFCNELSKLYLI